MRGGVPDQSEHRGKWPSEGLTAGERVGREERASSSVAMGRELRWLEFRRGGRRKKTGLVRTAKGSRPLRGTHKVEGGTGKNMIETLSFGVLAAMGWHVVWHCDVGRRMLKKKMTVVRMVQ